MNPHDHDHSHNAKKGSKSLIWAFAVTFSFMFAEWIGGVISGSLALIADAGHMLTDSSALMLSILAMWLAKRPASGDFSFGWRKAEVLGAMFNGVLLILLALWIGFEAWERAGQEYKIQTDLMIVIAFLGLLVNFLSFKLLHGSHEQSVNIRSAMFHVIGDILGSIGALVAGAIIHFTGYTAVDLWISIFIMLLIFSGAIKILLDSTKIILDAYPATIDPEELKAFLLKQAGVVEICDLHVWGVNSSESILTAHLVVEETNQNLSLVAELNQKLKSAFSIEHITIQLEPSSCELQH